MDKECWKSIEEDKSYLEGFLPCGTKEEVIDALLDLNNRLIKLEKSLASQEIK